MKFLHTADLHIDARPQSLEAYEGAPVERLQAASRAAFENVVTSAIDERVDFVVIAGDLFDAEWKDMRPGLWMANQFRRWEEAEIPVYLIRGNHDSDAEMTRRLKWPSNVFEFPVDQPATLIDELTGVALHGQGFAARSVEDDLTLNYPDAVPDRFNIGLLHTSLEGESAHATYAPTSVDRLVLSRYNYWALGHVHSHEVVNAEPYVVFPGCVQGRSFRECGPKGCVLVEVDDAGRCDVSFRDTSAAHWEVLTVELEESDDLDDLRENVRRQLSELVDAAQTRLVVCRLILTGACELHQSLQEPSFVERFRGGLHDVANSIGSCWLGQVRIETQPLVDIDVLRSRQDLLGELLQDFERLATGPDDDLIALAGCLSDLETRAVSGTSDLLAAADIAIRDPDQLRHWLRAAESQVVSLLHAHGDDEFAEDESLTVDASTPVDALTQGDTEESS